MEELYKLLANVQQNLNAKKSKYNSHGRYNYRSTEDIIEAAKPLIKEAGAVLMLEDDIEEVGGHNYVKATAVLRLGDKSLRSASYAREPMLQKGMNDPQMTGSASSYARKYALCGLFAIDDGEDADTAPPSDNTPTFEPIDETQKSNIQSLMTKLNFDAEKTQEAVLWVSNNRTNAGDNLTKQEAAKLIGALSKRIK